MLLTSPPLWTWVLGYSVIRACLFSSGLYNIVSFFLFFFKKEETTETKAPENKLLHVLGTQMYTGGVLNNIGPHYWLIISYNG